MRSVLIKLPIAIVLALGVSIALPHAASATKRQHHPAKVQTKKPAEQYMRSAAPSDPEHAQR